MPICLKWKPTAEGTLTTPLASARHRALHHHTGCGDSELMPVTVSPGYRTFAPSATFGCSLLQPHGPPFAEVANIRGPAVDGVGEQALGDVVEQADDGAFLVD